MALTTIQTDGITVNNQPPGTYGPFNLVGGTYAITTVWGASATISVNKLGPDNSTEVAVFALTSSSPYVVIGLAPGLYQVVIGVAASSCSVQKIVGT